MILVPLLASPGQAVAPPASESFGISANVNVAFVPITIAPQAASAYPGGPASMNTGSLGALGSLGAVTTSASGSDPENSTAASSSVAGLAILNLLTASAITSSCTADGGGVTGNGAVADLQALGLPINAAGGANTPVNLAGIGTAIINEQTITGGVGGRYTINVNALHITANVLGVLTGDIIVGHSECEADALAPTVTSVSPASGPVGGGTNVTIHGTGFTHSTAVSFGSVAATGFTVVNGTTITAVAPANSAGVKDITVTNASGASTPVTADRFTYIAAPAVTSISPAAGPATAGTVVTITGTDLATTSAVSFGGSPASAVTVDSDTQVRATAPAGTVGSTVHVLVTTPSGTSPATSADQFSYIDLPGVSGVSPASGPVGGGYSVVITGSDLSLASAVSFGGTPATSFVANSATQITAGVPNGVTPGVVHVVITTPAGTSVASTNDVFTYAATPVVSSLDVAAGPTGGGTVVTITGTGLGGATAVNFGGASATSFTAVNATTVQATSPGGSAGTVDVRVSTAGGTSSTSSADEFRYVAAPTVTGISPAAGPVSGGTIVVTGTGMTDVTSVHVGAAPATFVHDSPTQITVTVPGGSAGNVHITVTSPGGTSATSSADQYAYVAAPQISLVSPPTGSTQGGTSVIISGTGFTGASAVTFGGAPATYTVDSPTQITAFSPGGTAGPATISVTTTGGSGSAAFTYLAGPVVTPAAAPPSLAGLTPSRGSISGGTLVTLTGNHFSTATGVRFGTALGTDLTIVDDSTITVRSPAHGRGSIDVTVLGPGGSSGAVTFSFLSAADAPTVTTAAPVIGPVAGGTTVTLTGTDFDPSTTVSFGGVPGTGLVLGPLTDGVATTLTVIVPAHPAGRVDIAVSNAGGLVTATPAFTYIPPLVATTITVSVRASASKSVAPEAVSYAGAEVRSCGSVRTTIAADLGACVYTAPASAGSTTDRFVMSVVDVLGQTAEQTVSVTILPGTTGNDGGSGGTGGGGGGGGGTGGGGGGTNGGNSGTGGGGGGGGGTNGTNGGTGGTGGSGSSGGTGGNGGNGGTGGTGANAGAGAKAGAGGTGVDSQLATGGDELNSAAGQFPWLWTLAGLLLLWFLYYAWRRRYGDDAESDRIRYEKMMLAGGSRS